MSSNSCRGESNLPTCFINLITCLYNIFIQFQALADPYLNDMAKQELEPSIQPISKLEFEFERRKLSKDDVRELIYAEVI